METIIRENRNKNLGKRKQLFVNTETKI